VRHGSASGRDWSTITALRFEIEAQPEDETLGAAIVSIDDMKLVGGGLWGYYWAAVAFQNEFANYGPYTAFVGPQFLEGQDLIISNLTPDYDAQTTKRRIAILGGSITEPMVTMINDNTTTTMTYNELDSNLTEVETHFYNKPPTGCLDMVAVQNRIFMVGAPGYPGRVVYSEQGLYEAFPLRNYLNIKEGESLKQICEFGQNVAVRGSREYLLFLSGSDPAYWSLPPGGAKQGSVSSRFLLELETGVHVYMSENGLYFSSVAGEDGLYLPKINTVITNPSSARGAIAGQVAYLYFGNGKVLRIDYRLNAPVAHYVANISPTAIFEDVIAQTVCYTIGDTIYKFDASPLPLPTSLEIPGQFFGSNRMKAFDSLEYQLSGGPISLAVKYDNIQVGEVLSLADAGQISDPQTLPQGCGKSIGFTLSSTMEDYTLTLPIDISGGEIG
jgi:hypothetical protein